MKRTILSLFTVGVVSVLALMSTQAFFNDTETSTGNVLVAGALDLKIDNTCYYNGFACAEDEASTPENPSYSWEGGLLDGEPCSCTWQSKDLEEGDVFFNLTDLKPGDWEEDTISVNVDNPSWLCADINVTENRDNSCTSPETADELANQNVCTDPDGEGELAENLYFVFWRDDGDNVFEDNEVNNVLTRGTADAVLGNTSWALADSEHGPGPIPAEETIYIGKFFCFGDVSDSPVAAGVNSPTVASGFLCNGEEVDNQAQTDSLMGDITFYAEQARHNEEFVCSGRENGDQRSIGAALDDYTPPLAEVCDFDVDDSGGEDSTTINGGIALASNGDTVCVADGTYAENVVIDKNVDVAGDGALATSVINGNVTLAADGAELRGFEIHGNVSSNFHNNTIEYNEVFPLTGGNGITFGGTSGIGSTISNNVVTTFALTSPENRGIYLDQNGTTDFIVENNTVTARKSGFGDQGTSGTVRFNVFNGYDVAPGVGWEIFHDSGETAPVISTNNFNESPGIGVANPGDTSFDAPSNWWGDPSSAGNISGNVTTSDDQASAYPEN